MKRKLLTLFIACCMLASMLAGCTAQPTTTVAPTTAGTTKPGTAASAGTTATVAQPVTLTAIASTHALTKDVNTMPFLKEMEKRANVTIKWEQYKSGWAEKKSVLLASGDVPDLFVTGSTITEGDIAQFKTLFQPLNDLLTSQDTPNIIKAFAEHPELKALSTSTDGKIYGLPKYKSFWPKTGVRQLINKTWLDNLNLQVPTTFDELYNVLLAFKTKDPNKNGKADEIPMDWAPGIGSFNALSLISSYGIVASQQQGDGFYVENKKVQNFFVNENYKSLIGFLNKCWAAGLINPEVFTQDYTKFQAVTRSQGAPVVGYTYGWTPTDRCGNEWAPQYITMAPMKPTANYTGNVTWDYGYISQNYGAACLELTTKCKNQKAAVKFMDLFYDPYFSMQALFGSIPECIKDNGNGSYSILPPADTKMDPGTWKWTNAFADISPMYMADSLKLTLGTDMQAMTDMDKPFTPYLDKIDTTKDVWPSVFIKYTDDDNKTLTNIRTDILSVFQSKYAEWVTKGGVDAQWADYVKRVNSAGLPQALTIMQKYYDAYQAKK